MELPPTADDTAHRLRLIEIQIVTVLWLSGLNLIANVATIFVAFIAASGAVR